MVITIMQEGIQTCLVVALPSILVGLVIGLIISIFQAATQINEQTLAFVPKIIGIMLSLLLFGGFMINNLTELTMNMYNYAANLIS